MPRDYYEVLGVSRSANKDEIKRSFRQLARKWHPDVSEEENAESRFKEINEAYEILNDDEKRARYDRFGHAGVSGQAGGYGAGQGFAGFEEIFEEFFNNFGGRSTGGGRRRGPNAGGDRRVNVTVSFEEAVFGVEKEITFKRLEQCDRCEGAGAEPGTSSSACPTCSGSGEVRQVQQTFLGSMVRVATCPNCGGKGQVVETPCRQCDGSGRLLKSTTLNVKIPPGVRGGLQIQVRGEGDVGEPGAPNGNLYVVIEVEDHQYFMRRDNDILMELQVNVAQAALGDKVVVPTVDGDVELTIPAGTQPGKVFRMRGRGFPRLRSDGSNAGRGDQLISINVGIPTKLTEDQREMFEQLADTLGSEVQPQANGRGFMGRVMDFFAGE